MAEGKNRAEGLQAGTTEGLRNVQDLESVLNEGLRMALLEEAPDRSLEVLLEHLGKALNGGRTYIFERNASGNDDNTYEWVAPGVTPEKAGLQNVPAEVCAVWYERFSVGRNIVIKHLEEIRQTDPLLYAYLEPQGIHSLVVVPLYDAEQVIGFYGVDNPPAKSLEYASNMLQTAAYFIVSALRRRNLFRELRKRSYSVLRALSVDYLDILLLDLDTGEFEAYRSSERLSWNWTAELQKGYQAAMERYIDLYVVPRDRERLRKVTRKESVLARLRSEKKFSVRYQVEDRNDGLKHLEFHFSAPEDAAGQSSVIFAQRDVNAVVAQEEQYRLEARRNLEDILEGARTGIWTIELEEGQEPRMYADRTMRILLGVPDNIGPEECYRHWFGNIMPDYVEMVQEAVREILSTGRAEVTYPWNHPKLGRIYVRCGGVPDANFKKQGVSLIGYHQDITETTVTRKRQEQAIMELLEKVHRANSAKSEFLSHMSHDLRTPINGILGMLSIMEECPSDAERQADCREKIRVSTEHLLSLVTDVLQVSKLESGQTTVAEESFDLYDVLDSCITILSIRAEATHIRLNLEEVNLKHSRLLGNPLYIKQILMNIIENAIKYNRPGGAVYVQAQELTCSEGTAAYRFTVEDTGIGIGEEFKEHIFEPFAQEHPDARTHYNGVGLGMSIVKRLVDQMKGSVEITSQKGKGSVVRVELPLRLDSAWTSQPADETRNTQNHVANMRVLLVEDNEINCEIMEFMLTEAGAQVVTAHNGKIAVEAFRNSTPGTFDCVLMDLMMPVMSGYEATRVIRDMEREDAGTVPIIALSANAFEEDIAMAKDAGMNAHLAKPVDMKKLFKLMGRLRRQQKDFSAS